MLNELNREEVYGDVLSWLEEQEALAAQSKEAVLWRTIM